MTHSNDKFLKVIETLGEMLIDKDNKIKFQQFEIDRLKNKIINIEKYVDYYSNNNAEKGN